MPKTAKKTYTAEDVVEGLRARYPAGEWALLEQVGNATGYGTRSWCDAIAMNLWPSRGLAVHGFEIKVHRSDWLKELRTPHKADIFVERCDYWWLVVGDRDIVKLGELPDGWGLLYMHGKTLRCDTEARKQERDDLCHRTFLAAVLRQASNVMTPDAALKKAERKGYERGKGEQESHWKYTEEQHNALLQKLNDFEKASGLRIQGYMGGAELGRAVNQVLHGAAAQATRNLESLQNTAENIVKRCQEGLAELEAAPEQVAS